MGEKIRKLVQRQWAGLIALFLVLSGGTALATHPGGANTISSLDIINGEVRSADIGSGNVQNSDLGGSAVTGGKIAPGTVQGSDVQNDDLTGTDINESSLGFECPGGYEPAGKDVCYEPEPASAAHANANFDSALSTCADNGDRLPTLAEGWAIMIDLPNPPDFVIQQTWTADQSSDTDEASTLTKNFQGTITRSSTTTTTTFPFRCVTSPHG